MAARSLGSQTKLAEILHQWSDDSNGEAILFNQKTEFIYIPPSTVDALTDEEEIDDENLVDDVSPTLGIAGEIEVNCDSEIQDFSGPSTRSIHSDSKRLYTEEAQFGKPTWKKVKRHSFKLSEMNEEVVTPIEDKIVQDHSKCFSSYAIR